jgi:hypothetical protein
MLIMRRESFARCAAAVLVIGGHILLIVLLLRSHPRPTKGDAGVPSRGTLVILELRRLPDEPSAVAPEHTRAGVTAPRAQLRLPSVQPGVPPAPDTAIQALPVNPPIDWYREADIVARGAGARVLPPARTDCDEVSRPGSLAQVPEGRSRVSLGPGAEADWRRGWHPLRSSGPLRRGTYCFWLRDRQDRREWRAVQGYEASGSPDELGAGRQRG